MALTVKDIEEAKDYLWKEGYLKGENMSFNTVANLMAEWAEKKSLYKYCVMCEEETEHRVIHACVKCDFN